MKLKIIIIIIGRFQYIEVKGGKKKYKITRYLKLQQVAKNIEDVIYIYIYRLSYFLIVKSG